MDTLQNLIDGMTTEEANESLIVVFIAEVRTFIPNCPTQINSTATFIADRHWVRSADCQGNRIQVGTTMFNSRLTFN